ncbi:MAG TPA: hypothetical protein VGA76_11440 [Candidatus Dormibacteraeota bacterium]
MTRYSRPKIRVVLGLDRWEEDACDEPFTLGVTGRILPPLHQLTTLISLRGVQRSYSLAARAAAGAAVLIALAACDLPFGLGTPSTRALEGGAEASLRGSSFEMTGTYTGAGVSLPVHVASGARTGSPAPAPASDTTWTIDLQLSRPGAQHITVSGTNLKVEVVVVGGAAYFRGHQFLADHMGTDPLSQDLVKAAGNAWWKGSAGEVPQLQDLTDGATFRATFLGPAVTQRTDHVTVDGIDAVELSGPRADVFIAAQAPYNLMRVHMNKKVVIDGIGDGDFKYGNFDKDFGVAAPKDVIDFSNLSTLPPIYTVVSVDTSGCLSPCVVSALLKNLGGMTAAVAKSTVTFTLTDSVSKRVLGTCSTQVSPDVGYNATTTVTCTFANLDIQQANAATVTAAADNPGRA